MRGGEGERRKKGEGRGEIEKERKGVVDGRKKRGKGEAKPDQGEGR